MLNRNSNLNSIQIEFSKLRRRNEKGSQMEPSELLGILGIGTGMATSLLILSHIPLSALGLSFIPVIGLGIILGYKIGKNIINCIEGLTSVFSKLHNVEIKLPVAEPVKQSYN